MKPILLFCFQLFRQVRITWADVEKAEREKQKNLGVKDTEEQNKSMNEENTTNKERVRCFEDTLKNVESRSEDEIANITNIKVENETEDLEEPSGETLVEKTTLVQTDVEVSEPNMALQKCENKNENVMQGIKLLNTTEAPSHEERTLNDQETIVH